MALVDALAARLSEETGCTYEVMRKKRGVISEYFEYRHGGLDRKSRRKIITEYWLMVTMPTDNDEPATFHYYLNSKLTLRQITATLAMMLDLKSYAAI